MFSGLKRQSLAAGNDEIRRFETTNFEGFKSQLIELLARTSYHQWNLKQFTVINHQSTSFFITSVRPGKFPPFANSICLATKPENTKISFAFLIKVTN
jgi:hypothetical protein